MRIVVAPPPNMRAIEKAFGPIPKSVIFAFGDVIYNPGNCKIQPAIIAHEQKHGSRQGPSDYDVLAWWDRYIADPAFRLEEEVPAHQAEYKAFCKRHGGAARTNYLNLCAQKLASPLYGNLVTVAEARHMILTGGRT